MKAVCDGDSETVEQLLETGAKLDEINTVSIYHFLFCLYVV